MMRVATLVVLVVISNACGASARYGPTATSVVTAVASATPTRTPLLPTATPTVASLDLAPFHSIIRELSTALATGDRVLFASLFGYRRDSYQGMMFATWTVPSDGPSYIPSTPANIDELLRAPALRATSIVSSRGATGTLVTGVLVEGWDRRTLSVSRGGTVELSGRPDLTFEPALFDLRGDVVFIFYRSRGPYDDPSHETKFFGIAPAQGFVKIAALP